mgnify:FL=1|tara:strand:- start:15608 stop:16024 length:417 start_codon:yes stop_codon:yes gene_type:complete
MKKNELKIINRLNEYLPKSKSVSNTSTYHRFDAYNDDYVIEIKYRNKMYKDFIIEFDKYAYNKLYAEINNKKFLYVVGFEDDVYVYNITNLDKSGYNYNWQMIAMPKQTEFEKNWDINKYVGYLELWAAKKIGAKDEQ